jgi:hypothetical protein
MENNSTELLNKFEADLQKHLNISLDQFTYMVRDEGRTLTEFEELHSSHGHEAARKHLYLSMAALCRLLMDRELSEPITFEQYIKMIVEMDIGLSDRELEVHRSTFN